MRLTERSYPPLESVAEQKSQGKGEKRVADPKLQADAFIQLLLVYVPGKLTGNELNPGLGKDQVFGLMMPSGPMVLLKERCPDSLTCLLVLPLVNASSISVLNGCHAVLDGCEEMPCTLLSAFKRPVE